MKKQNLSLVKSDNEDTSDGRRKRSERSREKILKAMWELMLDGDMDPSAAAIAEHAGVGLRSVFRHFEDLDTLYRELILLAEGDVTPALMQPLESAGWKDRLYEVVERSVAMWERVRAPHTAGEIRRFKSDILMDDYKRSRMKELSMIKAVLPEDLPDYDLLLLALDNIISFSTIRRLREDRNLSLSETRAAMKFMVAAYLKDL